MGRTNKAAKNGIAGMISYCIQAIASLYTQYLFIKILGYNVLGLNTILYTIINSLAITEMGIGTAIVFSLYEPLAKKDERKVAALVRLYKKFYTGIGIAIGTFGIILIPLLPTLTQFKLKDCLIPYLLVLVNAAISYFLTYNQTILNADQRNYVVSSAVAATKVAYNILQIIALTVIGSYIFYILSNITCSLISNIFLYRLVKRQYPYLDRYKDKLARNDIIKIKENIIALVYHKVGRYLVSGADNIIISMLRGVASVGYYSNYTLISANIINLLHSAFSGFTSGFGNLLALEDRSYVKKVFKRACMLNNCIYTIFTAGYFICINVFLEYCFTKETILPMSFLIVFCLNFYLTGYSVVIGNIRSAAGIFKPDRYLIIVVAIINLVISIVLVKFIGITGALLGTLFCLIIKECIVLPVICSKYIFKDDVREYFRQLVRDIWITVISICISLIITNLFTFENLILQFICKGITTVAVTVSVLTIAYNKNEDFKYCITLVKGVLNKFRRKMSQVRTGY